MPSTSSKRRKPRLVAVADANERGQRRQPLRLQSAGRAAVDLRRELAQHADIVAGLERVGGDQRLAADLVERVFELGQPIGRVDVDQDQAGLGGGELGHHPFGVVRRPDADAVARREPERQQAGGERVDFWLSARHRSSGHSAGARSARRGRPSAPPPCRNARRWSRRSAASSRRRGHSFASAWPLFPPGVLRRVQAAS